MEIPLLPAFSFRELDCYCRIIGIQYIKRRPNLGAVFILHYFYEGLWLHNVWYGEFDFLMYRDDWQLADSLTLKIRSHLNI